LINKKTPPSVGFENKRDHSTGNTQSSYTIAQHNNNGFGQMGMQRQASPGPFKQSNYVLPHTINSKDDKILANKQPRKVDKI
jgi:hypothetical protein